MPKAIKKATPERGEFEVGLQVYRILEITNNRFIQIPRGAWEEGLTKT